MTPIGADLLSFDPGVFAWSVVVFILLFLALRKWAWGPLSKALDARERRIQERFDEAAGRIGEAEKRLAEYEGRLAAAGDEVEAILAKGRADAEAVGERVVAEARREAERVHERTRREILLAKDQAAEELRREIAVLSAEIAGKVLDRSVDPDEHRKFIEACLREYEGSKK